MEGSADFSIQTWDLTKVYPGGTRALDGVSFGVERGELFGLLGPNGAGKTTAIRILSTLLSPTSGTARVAGFDVRTAPQEVRRRLGLAMQTPSLDAFSTGRETLELAGRLHRMPGRDIRRRADELLEMMGLTAVAGKLTGTFSGGMKRRLDLAAALMHRPEVLILDEPTEGLDPQSRTALWEELARVSAAGTTMLLTTHYMEEADHLCTRLAIIDNGRIVVEGTPAQLKGGISAEIVVLQIEPNGARDKVADVRRLLQDLVPPEGVCPYPGGVTLAVADAGAAIPALLRRLEGSGVRVSGLQMSRPSLDDVFLQYTGRRIREEAANEPLELGW